MIARSYGPFFLDGTIVLFGFFDFFLFFGYLWDLFDVATLLGCRKCFLPQCLLPWVLCSVKGDS